MVSIKIQTHQDKEFRTLKVLWCCWRGNSWNWKGDQKAERQETCASFFFTTLTLLDSIYHRRPTLPTVANVPLASFFIADMHSNISYGLKKQHETICCSRFLQGMTHLYSCLGYYLGILNILIVCFFHSNKNYKRKTDLIIFSYHAG